MDILINKGGFRERANRGRKYKDSENEKTTLSSNIYQPSVNPRSDKTRIIHTENPTQPQERQDTD